MPHNHEAVPPERSHAQRMAALTKANAIRLYRADVKRKIRRFELHPGDVLYAPDDRLAMMSLPEFLLSVPGFGVSKCNSFLARNGISASKTIGGLTARQRDKARCEMYRYVRVSAKYASVHFPNALAVPA